MGQTQISERIDAPVERVFELATDLPRAAEHIDGINRIELLTDGPIGVGTKWRETRTMMGKEATEVLEVTAFDRPHGYTAEAESCGAHYWSTFSFAPDGDGDATLVTLAWRWRAVSLSARLMSPLSVLMLGGVKKMLAQDLADLKRAAES